MFNSFFYKDLKVTVFCRGQGKQELQINCAQYLGSLVIWLFVGGFISQVGCQENSLICLFKITLAGLTAYWIKVNNLPDL